MQQHGTTTFSTKKVPFDRVSIYQRSFAPPPMNLHAVIKHKHHVYLRTNTRLFETYFYTVPVRKIHDTEYQNHVLAFTCPVQARIYAELLNDTNHSNRNLQEPLTPAVLESYRTDELIHNVLMVSMPIIVIRNSFCNGQQEPVHEVTIIPIADMPNASA